MLVSVPSHLLVTKLHPPLAAGSLIPRPRLLDRLADTVGRRLTLISAPPGYGKTTLVKLWLDEIRSPYGWLSLDEYDADLGTLAGYLVAAVQTIYPNACHATASLLSTSLMSDPPRLADAFLRDLEQLAGPIFVVLDDYHLAQSLPVQTFMARVIQHLPPFVHLVLVTRSDPPLPLAQLRGRRQMNEIRAADLRFSAAESGALIRGFIGETVSSEISALLVERAEGWPAGLQLASLSLRDSDDPVTLAQRFLERNDRLVAEYLIDEILDRLPEEQRRLLLCISVPDQICGPLCEVVPEGPFASGDGEAALSAIWQSNLFLIALDEEGKWYRFHHLFLDLLRHQLRRSYSDEAIAAMHGRAAGWYESQGFVEEAIVYATRAGEDARAARLVEAHMHEVLNREDPRRLERWLKLLPETVLRRPGLLIAQAFLQQFRGRPAGALALVEAAQAALENNPDDHTPQQIPSLLGELNVLRSFIYGASEDAEACIDCARRALHLLQAEMLFARSLAEINYFQALQRTGRSKEAIDLAQAALARQVGRPDARTFRLLLSLCAIHHAEANVPALHSIATGYRQLAFDNGFSLSLGWANACLGWTHYQRNEFSEAEDHFSQVYDARYAVHGRCALDGLTGLALTQHAAGRDEDARQTADDLRRLLLDRGMMDFMPTAEALSWSLELDSKATTTPESFALNPQAQIATNLWVLPVFVAIRACLRDGAPDRLATAADLLRTCRAAAEARHARRCLIEIGALEALLHAARGEAQLSLETLGADIRLGEPGGALRLFADVGPELLPILHQLQGQGGASAYIERILSAYRAPKTTLPAYPLLPPPPDRPAITLTNREIDILLLLERRLTNKEIAAHLTIAPDTVKKHAMRLYRKLDSANRRQAVMRARELGLLPAAPSAP